MIKENLFLLKYAKLMYNYQIIEKSIYEIYFRITNNTKPSSFKNILEVLTDARNQNGQKIVSVKDSIFIKRTWDDRNFWVHEELSNFPYEKEKFKEKKTFLKQCFENSKRTLNIINNLKRTIL